MDWNEIWLPTRPRIVWRISAELGLPNDVLSRICAQSSYCFLASPGNCHMPHRPKSPESWEAGLFFPDSTKIWPIEREMNDETNKKKDTAMRQAAIGLKMQHNQWTTTDTDIVIILTSCLLRIWCESQLSRSSVNLPFDRCEKCKGDVHRSSLL